MLLILKRKFVIALLAGSITATLLACGNDGQVNPQQKSIDTGRGSVAFSIVLEPYSTTRRVHQGKNFSNCSDISIVEAMVYDSVGAPLKGGDWDCADGNGTITDVPVGINRIVIVRGINNDDDTKTVLYEGKSDQITIRAGETTYVGPITVSLVDVSLLLRADQDGDGYTPDKGDCDDTDNSIHPGANDVCGDGIDNNCDHAVDEGCPVDTWYRDKDGDDYGDSNDTLQQTNQPPGYVKVAGDCNDDETAINPGADDVCGDDIIDQDCNSETCPPTIWYYDGDRDNFGDHNDTIHPNAEDLCGDGIDQDCDPEACSIQLPNLTSILQEDAQTKIIDIEMTVGSISQEWSDTIANGWVIRQSPAAGTIVDHGDTIDLVISMGLCDIVNSIGMGFNSIPAGTFTMGSPEDEPDRLSTETPQHSVVLTRPFYIQTTEVTQGQWEAVMGTNPSYFPECGNDCPVEYVSWYDSVIFCNRLSQREGLTPSYYANRTYTTVFTGTPHVTSGIVFWNQDANGYRLPTEAEWEYAARAGTTTAFANGPITRTDCDPNLDAMGWYYCNSENRTQLVTQKDSNAWGLFDMHGNVWEWCQDWYSTYPSGSVTDPVGPSSGSVRMIRGSAWNFKAGGCRAAVRSFVEPGFRNYDIGFRLAY